MPASVIVVGGGYGGAAAARALDGVAEVLLVEPRDAFLHNVAALRALVRPEWTERIFLPYDRLLRRGKVVHDRAVQVDSSGVTLASGRTLTADFIVLATGSAYPFPGKIDLTEGSAARALLLTGHRHLERARRVLILGAGPVGLELAGEILARWPDRSVTIVDPATEILGGGQTAAGGDFGPPFRDELNRQLQKMGVELLLGTSLPEPPASEDGEFSPFTVTTDSGREIEADIWYRCYGGVPVTGYLVGDLASARRPDGYLKVGGDLRVVGQDTVFAIGDITGFPEAKLARAAARHAEIVATNITRLLEGGTDLESYEPPPPGIVLPLGPSGGVSFTPETGVLGPDTTAKIKGGDLKIDTYRTLLGLKG